MKEGSPCKQSASFSSLTIFGVRRQRVSPNTRERQGASGGCDKQKVAANYYSQDRTKENKLNAVTFILVLFKNEKTHVYLSVGKMLSTICSPNSLFHLCNM